MDRVRHERMRAPVGDVPGAVRNLVETQVAIVELIDALEVP